MFDDRWDNDEARWHQGDDRRHPGRERERERAPDARHRDPRTRPQPGLDRLDAARECVRHRGCDYRLNEDDVRLLRTVGTFRAVYADHLREEHPSLDYQTRQLREQDLLVVDRIQLPDTRESAEVLTLTREGRRLLQDAEEGDQRYHWGLVQPRELHHDAHLYQVVQCEEERLAARGARIERVRLDEELRRAWWSREHADLEPEERAAALGVGLDDHGRVLFPDVQIEVREADDRTSRCNLELVTSHYSRAAMSAKAAAGFRMFSLSNSHARGGRVGRDRDRWGVFEL